MRLPHLFPLVLVVLLSIGLAAAPADALEVGMGDQRARMFTDPRFQQLGITRVRITVDWNVALSAGQRLERLDDWLAAARTHGYEPLIAFDAGRPGYLPSVSEYEQAFDRFQERYPWVRTYTTWNEANHSSQPTANQPEQVARYHDAIRARCRDCTVVAADVLDQRDMVSYVQRVRAASTADPTLWGVHNYIEVHRSGRMGSTAALLAAVPGTVWLTETGGIVKHILFDGRVNWPYDEQRAATSVARAFAVANSDPRIERIYLYQWSVDAYERWDSAFIAPDGRERPALTVLRDELAALRRPSAAPPPLAAAEQAAAAAAGPPPAEAAAAITPPAAIDVTVAQSTAATSLDRAPTLRSAARRRCLVRAKRLPTGPRRKRARSRCRARR